jgi:hypothetical protein
VSASAGAIDELERQHAERLRGQRLALERVEFEAERARRQFDACGADNLWRSRQKCRSGGDP